MSDVETTAHELWRFAKRVLAAHYGTCPLGCTATHIKCSLGDALVKAEDKAYWAAKAETLPPSPPYWTRANDAQALPGFADVEVRQDDRGKSWTA